MTTEDGTAPKFSLKRWSQRKHRAARTAAESPPAPAPNLLPLASDAAIVAPGPAAALEPRPVELPSVESLSFESDFTAFLRPTIDEVLKRQALKKLFSDPRFNVMDGLDIYIDDYTKADPIAPELVRELIQGRGIFGPREARAEAEESPADTVPEAVVAQAPGPAAPQETTATATAASDPAEPSDATPPDKATAAPR